MLMTAAFAAPALAVVPEDVVSGIPSGGSKWFSGSLIQQPGSNCSILGSQYTEIMVSGIGSYGGRGGVVKVGDEYWTNLLVSIPGNPCGSGSSSVVTELVLPRDTSIDPTRPIRCFYLPRNASVDQFQEVTGGQWQAFGSSGDVCPAQAQPAAYTQGGWNIGYRPLASGSMLQIFVPLKTTAILNGSGGPDEINWLTYATGVYANPGRSGVWANTFASGGSTPFVYFARNPSAAPFWKADAPAGLENRAEFWANFYVAGYPGQIHFEVRQRDAGQTFAGSDTTPGTGWNPTVAGGNDLLQTTATGDARGPNGGYVPFAYDPATEAGKPMRVTWTFTPSSGPHSGQVFSGFQDFTTMSGPDADGDGVADTADACPGTKGTASNGCMPAAPPDPDGDGVYGADDACPDRAAPGVVGGCPAPAAGGGTTTTPPPAGPGPITPIAQPAPVKLVGTLGVRKGTRLRAAALRRGVRVKTTCSRTSTAKVTLTVPAATGRKLGLKPKGRTATVAIRSAACTAGKTLTLVLKPAKKTLTRIGRLRKPVGATLALGLTAAGATPGGAKVAVKLG